MFNKFFGLNVDVALGLGLMAMVSVSHAQSVSPNPMQWHKVTVTYLSGDSYSETGTPNPFTERRFDVVFTKGTQSYRVPGYFAADGDAGNTGATSGKTWNSHFSPPESGTWTYKGYFYHGTNIHAEANPANPIASFEGTMNVAATSKPPNGRDFRGKGWLEYVSSPYLRFKGNGEYFLKQGPDSPENLLSYKDFDGDFKTDGKDDSKVKLWAAHVADWKEGDPTWAAGKGKGIIGALNYLASEGLNAISFLTMNINGDDKNVFPYLSYTNFERIDVSRMDQWAMVLDHGTKLGFFYDLKTQEAENQNLLDKGDTGPQRKLYYRELIARFGYQPGLTWNLGEENGVWSDYTVSGGTAQSPAQRRAMAQYFYDFDPYKHHIVLHNGQNFDDMLGDQSKLTGWSLQTFSSDYSDVYNNLKQNIAKSVAAKKVWAISSDESGGASIAVRPDSDPQTSHANARKNAMWGSFMAGSYGNQWYFGYNLPHSDLTLEDFRSRDNFWDYARYALAFFKENNVPFWEMKSAQEKVTNNNWALAKDGQVYVIYMKNGGTTDLDVGTVAVNLDIKWFNPRKGGALQNGTKTNISGTGTLNIGEPPTEKTDDWTALVGINNITSLSKESKSDLKNKVGFSYKLNSGRFLTGILKVGANTQSLQVSLFNLHGNQLKSEGIDKVHNGQIMLNWNLTDVKSGMYFVLIKADGHSQLEKIMVR
jgi:Domain of unknown function (DUF5060)/Putative collagen-binding domain of a collagenase